MTQTDKLPVSPPLPRYRCHKEVSAFKIKEFKTIPCPNDSAPEMIKVIPVDERIAPWIAGIEFYKKHVPYAGGYIVIYDDGYKSFSPAEAFESGYTLIPESIHDQGRTIVSALPILYTVNSEPLGANKSILSVKVESIVPAVVMPRKQQALDLLGRAYAEIQALPSDDIPIGGVSNNTQEWEESEVDDAVIRKVRFSKRGTLEVMLWAEPDYSFVNVPEELYKQMLNSGSINAFIADKIAPLHERIPF